MNKIILNDFFLYCRYTSFTLGTLLVDTVPSSFMIVFLVHVEFIISIYYHLSSKSCSFEHKLFWKLWSIIIKNICLLLETRIEVSERQWCVMKIDKTVFLSNCGISVIGPDLRNNCHGLYNLAETLFNRGNNGSDSMMFDIY